MDKNEEEKTAYNQRYNQRWLIRKYKILKYIILFGFFLLFGGAVLAWDMTQDESSGETPATLTTPQGAHAASLRALRHHTEFLHEMLVSAVAAIVVSLILAGMQDMLTRHEDRMSNELERDDLIARLLRRLSHQVFLKAGVDTMSEHEFDTLVTSLTHEHREYFVDRIVHITGERSRDFARFILEQYFGRLWNNAHRVESEWANDLLPKKDTPGRYIWRGTRGFKRLKNQDRFLVAVTDESIVASHLQKSEVFDDVLIAGRHGDATAKVGRHEITVHALPGRVVLEREEMADEELLRRLNGRCPSSLDRVKAYQFRLPEKATKFEYIYEVDLSLEEPVFYVRMDRISWIERIRIDYSRISSQLRGEVVVANFISPANGDVRHDEKNGTVVADIVEVLLPGEGVALVWTTGPAQATAAG